MNTKPITSQKILSRDHLSMDVVLLPIPQRFPHRSPPQSQLQSETTRHALLQCAEKIGAPLIGWEKDENNVPKPLGKYHWSVTHKKLWCAAVIADKKVGVDIEAVEARRKFHYQALGDSSEWDLLGEQDMHTYFRLWTAKEATLKANSSGIGHLLDCHLDTIEDEKRMHLIYQDQSWPIEHFYFDNHVAAVTCYDHDVAWNIEIAS